MITLAAVEETQGVLKVIVGVTDFGTGEDLDTEAVASAAAVLEQAEFEMTVAVC